MDVDKILELAPKYLSEYYFSAVATITQPGTHFGPEASSPPIGQNIRGPRLSGKLFVFMIINVLLGSTVNALIPFRNQGPGITTTAVVIIMCWFFYSTIFHLICKFFRGSGSYEMTLSVSLQMISIIYMIASFLTFSIAAITSLAVASGFAPDTGSLADAVMKNPITVFFMLQFLGLTFLLPLALSGVHKFGKIKTGLLVTFAFLPLAVIGVVWAIAVYVMSGILAPPPPP